MIEIRSLCKSYGKTPVLQDVNLNIPQGSVFGMVGINGAGKSTLLRLMAGVLKADKGSVCYEGQDVFENEQVKKDIFFLPDDPYYSTGTTGQELARLYSAFYRFDENIFSSSCELFRLDKKAPLRNFSKGMRRQMFLSLALASRPRFLLLDEAFDGLDPQSRLEFKRALISLTEEQNFTTVIASHSLRELTDICTHFALISGGRVADSGDLQEKLGAVYKFQIGLSEEASPALFPFPCLKCECSGRVAQIIVRGNREEIVQNLEALSPLFVEEIPVDFEEYFLIEADKGRERK